MFRNRFMRTGNMWIAKHELRTTPVTELKADDFMQPQLTDEIGFARSISGNQKAWMHHFAIGCAVKLAGYFAAIKPTRGLVDIARFPAKAICPAEQQLYSGEIFRYSLSAKFQKPAFSVARHGIQNAETIQLKVIRHAERWEQLPNGMHGPHAIAPQGNTGKLAIVEQPISHLGNRWADYRVMMRCHELTPLRVADCLDSNPGHAASGRKRLAESVRAEHLCMCVPALPPENKTALRPGRTQGMVFVVEAKTISLKKNRGPVMVFSHVLASTLIV